LKSIVEIQKPDVVGLCETKTGEGDEWKVEGYEGIVSNYKRGQEGSIVAARCGTFVSMEKVSELSNILAVQIVYPAITLRMIVCHAPQEHDDEELRVKFFENLAVEIERGKSSDEVPIVMGDFNAKISGSLDEVNAHSGNGKLMSELLEVTQMKGP
jgi:exonuclease III